MRDLQRGWGVWRTGNWKTQHQGKGKGSGGEWDGLCVRGT